jgi:hypothetical protein
MPTLFQAYGLTEPTPEATPAPEPSRTVLGTAGDVGLSLLKGAIAVPEAAVGAADLVTGGRAGQAAEAIGFRPREAREMLDEAYSDPQREAFRRVQDADGFIGTAVEALRNPSVIGHSILESLPLMGAGGVVGRGVVAAAPRAGMAAGAIGEGTVAAGSAAEQIRQQSPDGRLTPEQTGLAGAAGMTTGLFGFGGAKFAQSKLGQKLGIADVDTWLAGAQKNPTIRAGLTRRVLGGAVSEGLIEELPQSVSEQVLQNLALGKPLDEGVDQAAVLGLLSGAAMGGGFNAFQGGQAQAQPGPQNDAGAPIPPAGSDVPPPAPAEAGGILSPRGDPLAGNPGFDVNRTLVERGREADQDRRLDEGLDAAGFDARQRMQDELQGQRVWPVKQMERRLLEEAKADLDTVEALKKAGSLNAAAALKKSIDKKIAAKLSDMEVQALSSVDPRWGGKDFATLYVEKRKEGANQGDAAGHAATLAATLQLAKHAGMSDKAIAATYQKARGLDLDEIPDFVERAMQGLADRGIGKPMQGIAQALAGYRDEAILAAGNALLKEQEPAKPTQERAPEPTPTAAEPLQAGQRWTTDRGAMPGEPFGFLDGDADTARAAIVEVVHEGGRGSTFEVHGPDGELIAAGSTPEAAARLAEQRLDGATDEEAQAPAPAAPEAAAPAGDLPAVRAGEQPAAVASGADGQAGADAAADAQPALTEPTTAAEADAAWEAAKESGDSQRLQQAAAWVRQFQKPVDAEPVAEGGFDSEKFDRDRAERVKASREAGFTHLDKVPAYVETMRGKAIQYVHDPKVRGVIRTVANTGEVVVNWSDAYSAEKELATERMDGKKKVFQTWLMPSDLKDYRLVKEEPAQPKSTPRPDGTLKIEGEPKALKEQLKAAGVDKVMTAKDGVVVGKSQVEKAKKAIAPPRSLTVDGRATDGKPINPGDTFRTTSGRTTTEYPKQKGEKYATQWLIDNATAEARSRGDDFNARAFAAEKPGRDGAVPPASRDSMLEYLFGEQPAVRPSILKPLVAESAKSGTAEEAPKAQPEPTKAPAAEKPQAPEGAAEALAKYGLPANTGWTDGKGLIKGQWAASADGVQGQYKPSADEAAKSLAEFLESARAGRERDAAIKAAQASAAEKVKRGENPTFAEWKRAFPQLAEGHTYLRQPDISAFLVEHFRFSKARIREPLGRAAGNVVSDSGAKYPIVYFNRLAEVLGKKGEPAPAAEPSAAPEADDMRGYAWALVKDGKVVRSGSLPAPQYAPAGPDTKQSYYKAMADKEGADLYIGGYPGVADFKPQDGLIFGMTWDELNARQQRGSRATKAPEGKMPKDAVLAYSPAAAPEAAAQEGKDDFPEPPPQKPGLAGVEQVARIYIDRGRPYEDFSAGFKGKYHVSHEFWGGSHLDTEKLREALAAAGYDDAQGSLARYYRDLAAKVKGAPRDARTIAREIAKARPDDDFTAVREAARKAIVDELGQKAADEVGRSGGMMTGDELTQAVHDGQYEGIREFAAKMPVPVHESDIPTETAVRAYSGTSHSPERRGQSARRDYVRQMAQVWKRAVRAAGDDPAAMERITEQMRELVSGYRSRYLASLSAHSQVMSSMIAGPAKFPVRSNQKKIDTADRRAGEAQEFLEKGAARLIKAAKAPVDNSPESELARVKANLEQREKTQERMKAANAALRKGDDEALKALGFSPEQIADLKKPDFAGRTGFPDYALANNNAEIRRLRERLAEAEKRTEEAAAGPVKSEFNGVRIEENATDDRIRLFFDGKPSEEVRTDLKANAFKWSPNAGAWQRQLTDNARRAARTVLAKHYGNGEAPAFSLRDQQEDSSLSYEEVENIVDELTAKWQNRPDIRVLDSMSEAPPVVLKTYLEQRSQGAAGKIHGFHLKGTVYLVADSMAKPEDVQTVLWHESLGHFGLRGHFGNALRPMLADVILGQREKVVAKAKAYGLDMNKQADRLMAAEEVLAELAQTRPELGVIRRLVAAIRTWLRDNIPAFAKMKMTDDELIRKFILPARGFVERGQSPRPTFTIMGDEGPETVFHIAYHGSPHEFDKFSLDKIGTGEGAQAYGWGLYFAGKREVAEFYRDKLSREHRGDTATWTFGGKRTSLNEFIQAAPQRHPDLDRRDAENAAFLASEFVSGNRSTTKEKLTETELGKAIQRDMDGLKRTTGKLYEVEIPDEGSYLLWDEPLSKQPKLVRDAIQKYYVDQGTPASIARETSESRSVTGESLYRDLSKTLEGDREASALLHSLGIAGIKYMDGASRNRPLRELKREFLKELPQDADFDEVTDLFGTGTFSPANEAILKELQANDWLGFDYPAQAVSAALGGELANFDASDALKQAVADAQQGATFNYVVFDDSAVEIRAQFSLRADTAPDYLKAARQAVSDSITAPGTISWWSKTVGTPYHLAQKHPEFKRVFDRVQDFLGDVSAFATEAADRAPTILPKLETWKDILKTAISAEDTKAVGRPVWEGTLMWVRGEDGKPVPLSEKEAEAQGMKADEKAQEMLRRGLLRENVLKMWQGLPLEQFQANVETRYRNVMLKAGIVWTDAELKSMFHLDARQIGLYREFRAAVDHSITQLALSDMLRYAGKDADESIRREVLDSGDLKEASEMLRDHLIDRAKEDPDRNDLLLATAERVIAKADQARDLIEAGYAPLMRFGSYTVDVVDEAGNRLYFGLFETRSEAAAMARHMQEEYPKAAIRRGTVSNEEYKLFAGVSPETLELFGEMLGMESTGDAAKDKAFQEYLKLAKTNRSAMRRLIHRKGIAGFSEDVGRVLAGFVYSNARQSSANLHMGEIGDAANAIPQGQGQLKDQAVKLAEYVKNPQEEAQGIRGLLFAQYLGGSLAAAMVNMTQPVQVTMPYLSQFGGIKQSASQMKRALADVWKKSTGEADLDAALKRAVEEGIVAPQEVHQLMAQAMGRGSLKAGDGTRMGQAKAIANNAGSRLALAWGKFFSAAELFNRRVTFIAAYRIAKAQKMADPAGFAEKAVNETQFVYNKGNRPNWARGAVGSTLFTFKTYSISYLELMQRMYASGPEGKKAALFGMAMLLLMGGAGGVPFAEDVSDVIDGIGQRMGYNFSVKRARQQLLRDVLGEALGDFAEKGVSGLPGAPIDVAGRLGMGNLIPGTGIFVKKPDHTRDVLEIAGPAGDFAQRVARGVDLFGQGRPLSAVLEASPTAARNLAQSWEMATTGEYRDRMGRKVLESDTADAVAKAIGFQPGAVAKVQDASRDAQALVNVARLRESEIAAAWAKAIVDKDEDGRNKAREAVAEWNRKNPDTPIRISLGQIMRRVQNMRMSKAERLEKSAPKEIRQAARREMEQAR